MNIKHKIKIANTFSKSAKYYDQYAYLQRKCGHTLCKLLGLVSKQYLLDAGCGTGWFSKYWKLRNNNIIALDISPGMIMYAKRNRSAHMYLLGDIEQLPLMNSSIDIIYSNLAVQWCADLKSALVEFFRVLKPGGKLALSTLANGSLIELKQAWSKIDNNIHVNKFLSIKNISNIFSIYRHSIFTKTYKIYYDKLLNLLKEIKGVGASYLYGRNTFGLTGSNKLKLLEKYWPNKSNQLLSLSYQVVYGILYYD
ncbi:MAG: malonyl-ACP O-methyltransferase BioC [Candidatus Lightella neohaematopini]|nr:malonyl-ACP O-methyltransferase BioC [Candidatus Lightella neohaematopini]